MNTLRFNGSLWCNLDIALRNLDKVYEAVTKPLGLTVIEWYILRVLYQKDSQNPSKLAQSVGRAPTSFTRLLDGLEQKELTKRRPDPHDRRVVRIYLTDKGNALRDQIQTSANEIDARIQQSASKREWEAFQRVLAGLQSMTVEGGSPSKIRRG